MKDDLLVIKVCDDFESIAYEIKVLIKIERLFKKKFPDEQSSGFPTVVDYGIFSAKNVHPADVTEKKVEANEESDKNEHIFGYYIMPKYSISLQNFMNRYDSPSSVLI